MKRVKYTILSIFFLGFIHPVLVAQEAKKELSLNLGYFNNNYHLQYLKASAKTKLNGRFQPVAGLKLSFYITDESPSNLLGKGVTNEHGEAVIYMPSSAKDEWNKSANQSFLAVSEASSEFEATKASADIVKTKMKIDTATDR